MSDKDAKVGPLTLDDLLDVWSGSVDSGYSEPFIRAGDGSGFEAYKQVMAQLARVATAVDVSTQALYILPHSSQTSDPAAGEAKATVTLKITRTGLLFAPLLLGAGQFVEENQTDFGPDGGIPVKTGRRFALAEDVFFPTGDQGPKTVLARAELPGWGYNNPQPESLSSLAQPGTAYSNSFATVVTTFVAMTSALAPRSNAILVGSNRPDEFIQDHVGQFVRFTSGSNVGKIARIIRYIDSVPPVGSQVELELSFVVEAFSVFSGTFVDGEQVIFRDIADVIVAYGFAIGQVDIDTGARRAGFVLASGSLATAVKVGNVAVTAALTWDVVLYRADDLVAEFESASWQILDFVTDWGIAIGNALSPTGGRLGMLDALGDERKVRRSPGESDDAYRIRVAKPADVVSPNAIKRAINRVLVPLGLTFCFREVGDEEFFPGLFYDGSSLDPVDSAGAYDFDFTTRPSDRFKVPVSFREMRAFFLVGVPTIPPTDDFGFFYDGAIGDAIPGLPGGYDLPSTTLSPYDGFPRSVPTVYKAIYQAIDDVRAAGVGFDLYPENGDCP